MTTLVDTERWTADQCREYLRWAAGESRFASSLVWADEVQALVSRVRTRLASLQLAELWPVDPRD